MPAKSTLIHVLGGRDPVDPVLALSSDNEVSEIRGDRVRSLGRPSCPKPGDSEGPPHFRMVARVGDHLELHGSASRMGRTEFFVGVTASNANGRWTCAVDGARVDFADRNGGTGWYGADGFMVIDIRHLTREIPRFYGYTARPTWTAASEVSVWMWLGNDPPWFRHFNGTVWEAFPPPPLLEVSVLFQDERDAIWAIGENAKPTSETKVPQLLAKMVDQQWRFVSVPADFDADAMAAAKPSADYVWFFGTHWWAWDGKALHRMDALFKVRASWASPTGSLWIAGDGLAEITRGPQ